MPKSAKVFAVGDVHGCALELKSLIQKLPLAADSTLVFLGDYIDRGPNSKGVIDQILELRSRCQVICLMGNHESMLLEFLRDPSSSLAGYFVLNGGSATLASYANESGEYTIPSHHLTFLKSLRPTFQTASHFFVHAGVPELPLEDLNPNEYREDFLWIRQPFLSSDYRWSKVIVHGHSPRQQVERRPNRINVDTGCVYGVALSAIDVNSGEVYRVEARTDIPKVYLRDNPQVSRVAKRFVGSLPVEIFYLGERFPMQTLNYNEFGLLLLDDQSRRWILDVGDEFKGLMKAGPGKEISFTGQVVRQQARGSQLTYGVRILQMDS